MPLKSKTLFLLFKRAKTEWEEQFHNTSFASCWRLRDKMICWLFCNSIFAQLVVSLQIKLQNIQRKGKPDQIQETKCDSLRNVMKWFERVVNDFVKSL